MKKKIIYQTIILIVFTICFIMILGCGEKKEMKPDCVISNSFNDDYFLTIIANREIIEDKEMFAKQLIEQVCNNDFKSIMFSFEETGYPTGLSMHVYLTESDWEDRSKEPYMEISFRQENSVNGYNIVENYDEFKMEVNVDRMETL